MWNPNFVINVPADGLIPNGARPSAGTVLTEKLNLFSSSLYMVINDSVYPLGAGWC